MVATEEKEVIRVGNWMAKQCEVGGNDYYIYDHRGNPMGFRGLARSRDVAVKWLEDGSGLTYSRLPPVKMSELCIVRGEKIRDRLANGHRGWYRITQYFIGDKLLGRTQVKVYKLFNRERVDVLTSAEGSGAVLNIDIRWMLEQNGLRLVDN